MNTGLKKSSLPRDEQGTDQSEQEREQERRRAEDKALVQRAQAGDKAAFQVLFETYNRRAYAVALGVVRNPDDALDVVQDAFIKAHRYLPKFEGASSFYTWLYRIVMNLCIDHLRRNKRKKQVDFNDAVSHLESQGAVVGQDQLMPRILGANPSKSLVRKEIRAHIRQGMAQLSDNHRMVLTMREVDGMSYEEMASVMKCSKGTIMSRLFHARKNMQEHLIALMGSEHVPKIVEGN